MTRILAFFLGFLSLCSCAFVYLQYVYQLGFPDGSSPELDRAEEKLALAFCLIGAVLAAYFFSPAARASGRRVGLGFLAYLSVAVLFVLVDASLQSHLTGGGGG